MRVNEWAEGTGTFVICTLSYGTWFAPRLVRSTLYEFAQPGLRMEPYGKQTWPHFVRLHLRVVVMGV